MDDLKGHVANIMPIETLDAEEARLTALARMLDRGALTQDAMDPDEMHGLALFLDDAAGRIRESVEALRQALAQPRL